jgi:hypothetical protein
LLQSLAIRLHMLDLGSYFTLSIYTHSDNSTQQKRLNILNNQNNVSNIHETISTIHDYISTAHGNVYMYYLRLYIHENTSNIRLTIT